MARQRREPEEAHPIMGAALEFFDLIERLPPSVRPGLLMEEKARLEERLAKVNELLEGKAV